MKNFLLLLCLLVALCHPVRTSAQEKGAAPITSSLIPHSSSLTRAVVIGISDYADERIPDLQFAHRDAEAFAAWLQSPAGGSLPAEQISLLLNQQATLGKMVAGFDWLIAKSKPGDRAFIYFSGHGDVEKVTKFNRGYLLAYDMPGTTYMAGGMNLRDLQDIIATLSDASVQVVMISDACRAGKLAGSENGGTQATAAALQQQFAKEIKILSCQPDEFSLEGEQWGGGRGCFSFHLTDGLTGMADQNADLTVELREISRYLQDKVSAEADPSRQMPVTVGNAFAPVASVDEPSLKDLLKRKGQESPTLLTIKSKGMEDLLLASADTSVQELYKAFTAAVERGELLQAAVAGQSANDYFERLMQAPGIEDLQGMVKRNFAAALQDEAQVVVNKLLRTDPKVVDDAFPGRVRYAHLPAYLARAAEILGEKHYMFKYLKCKQYFFEAKTYSKVTYPELPPDSLLQMSLRALDRALAYDSSAAFVYLERGLNYYWKVSQYAASAEYFKKARELSPSWVMAVYYYGRTLWHNGDTHSAIQQLKEALKYDSTFLPTYERLGFLDAPELRSYWRNRYVQKMERLMAEQPENIPATYYRYMGLTLYLLGRNEEAEKFMLIGARMTNFEDPLYYKQLGWIYQAQGRTAESCQCFNRYFEQRPSDYEIYGDLANCGSIEKVLLFATQYHQPKAENDAGQACGLYRFYLFNHNFIESKKVGMQHVERIEKGPEETGYGYGCWYYGFPSLAETALKEFVSKIDTAGYIDTECPICPFGLFVLVNLAQNDLKEAEYWWEKRNKQDASYNSSWSDGWGYGLHTWLAYAQGKFNEVDSLIEHHSKVVPLYDLIEDMLLLISIADQVDYAIFILDKSRQYFPGDAPLHYHLARLHLEQKNDYEKGVPLLEKAVQLDSTHAYAHYHLAAAYAHLGKNKAALAYLEQALQKGYEDYEQIQQNERWNRLRKNKRFQAMMKRHFSDKWK